MDIPIAEPSLGEEELKNVEKAIQRGWISSKGEFIQRFEREFSNYCDRKYGVATSNGTTALHLALEALDIGQGDEVLIPDLTFAAVANAVSYCEAKPIFIESNPEYWCIDPEKIEKKITKKTKAIIPVHLYGHPCDMEPILEIARKYDLRVIEDGAEAHGAEYKKRKIGSFGDVSCFSFYGNKTITTGEGGICLTDQKKVMEEMKILRDHGMSPDDKYWHEKIGFNYRMTNLQAAVGVAQLKKLDRFLEKKRKIKNAYENALRKLSKKNLITLHPEMPWGKCSYWMYSILIEEKSVLDRNALIKKLSKAGIETRPFFHPIHKMPPYRTNNHFPIAKNLSRKGINLPSSPNLREEEIRKISKHIIKYVGG